MNILPHKSWHVRTKKNIARVRRDEALAVEQEKERQHKVQLAESEARLNLLRKKVDSDEPQTSSYLKFADDIQDSTTGHINFFKDDNLSANTKSNAAYEEEKKSEREKYEKKVGYLTYLGQDTNEALGKQSWYEIVPDRSKNAADDEIDLKRKSLDDPLNVVNKALKRDSNLKLDACRSDKSQAKNQTNIVLGKSNKRKTPKKKRRKKSANSSASSTTDSEDEMQKLKLQKLREERLKREQEERKRVEILFGKKDNSKDQPMFTQKYSSQFNPHLAKQNFVRR